MMNHPSPRPAVQSCAQSCARAWITLSTLISFTAQILAISSPVTAWATDSAPRTGQIGPQSAEAYAQFQKRALKLLANSVAQPILQLELKYLAPAPQLLHDEGADDQNHLDAIESVEASLSKFLSKMRSNQTALLRVLGVDEKGRLNPATLGMRLKLIEIGIQGTASADDEISRIASDALIRYLLIDAKKTGSLIAGKNGKLSSAISDLLDVQVRLGQKESREILFAPVMPAVDFTVGVLCLTGMIAGVFVAPESGGSSLLVSIGAAATAVSKLETAVRLGQTISRGQDLSPWDATILMNILPTGEGAKAFDVARALIVAGKGIDVARGFDPKKLYSKSPAERLSALQELVTILQVKTSLGTTLKSANAAAKAGKSSAGSPPPTDSEQTGSAGS